jgi:hypothetical protein
MLQAFFFHFVINIILKGKHTHNQNQSLTNPCTSNAQFFTLRCQIPLCTTIKFVSYQKKERIRFKILNNENLHNYHPEI